MKLIIALLLAFPLFSQAKVIKPTFVKALKRVTVKVTNFKQSSGGTGSILQSDKSGSLILTNKHVCRLIEQGGSVVGSAGVFDITHYKKFPSHDLCIVSVKEDLGVTLVVSKKRVKPSDSTIVSGHPSLLPHIATKGHISDKMTISLMAGLRDCTKADMIQTPIACSALGGIPVIEIMESQVVSNLIQPGSSGSAVYNSGGEIVGVVFAGDGGSFSHGLIVPQQWLKMFLGTQDFYEFVKVGTAVEADNHFSERTFGKSCEKALKNKKLKRGSKDFHLINRACKKVKSHMIEEK